MAVQATKSLRARLAARRRKIGKWLRGPACRRLTQRTIPIMTIFGVCAFISYGHIHEYTLMGGESERVAALMPILYDAMMFVSAQYIASARHIVGKLAAFVGFLYGFAMSLVANIAASDNTVTGKVIGTSVAFGLVITAITIHWGDKPARKRRPAPRKAAAMAPKPVPSAVLPQGDPYRPAGLHAVAEPAYR